jgi:glutamate/tyrosine decarboxylase-like PLP-dependent enzyme
MTLHVDEIGEALAGRPALLRDACTRALAYLDGLADRPVAPGAADVAALGRLDIALPGPGLDAAAVLALLDEAGSPATVASGGPRYFGFVTGGALPVAQAAAWLSTAWDQNAALPVMSPAASVLNSVALRWVTELLGLPAGTGGGFVTGATMANATCLAAARDAVLTRHGWDAAGQGLVGAPPVTVVAGAQAHTTVRKALGLVGLGRDRAVVLPTDDQGRIEPRDLPSLTGPSLVCLQAGNVNSGASDPFPPLIAWARDHGAWVHVDGAFGLWAAASPALRSLTAGAAEADSWATDGHKWLNVPYDCGLAIVRDPAALTAALGLTAAYLPGSGERDSFAFTPESSRRARAVPVYAALRSLGRRGVAELVERCCALARLAASELSHSPSVEVLNDVVLNQVLLRVRGADTAAVIERVQRDGTCWLGGTSWRGQPAIRFSVSNWSTTEGDIRRAAAAIVAAVESAAAGPVPPP